MERLVVLDFALTNDMAGRALKQALACDHVSGETDLARALSARLA